MSEPQYERCPTCGTTCVPMVASVIGSGGVLKTVLSPVQDCRCWPPGSGEEWCTGHCLAREQVFAAICGLCREQGPPLKRETPDPRDHRRWLHDDNGLVIGCGAGWVRDLMEARP